jgi:hypothetical protein
MKRAILKIQDSERGRPSTKYALFMEGVPYIFRTSIGELRITPSSNIHFGIEHKGK